MNLFEHGGPFATDHGQAAGQLPGPFLCAVVIEHAKIVRVARRAEGFAQHSPLPVARLSAEGPAAEAARKGILETIRHACGVPLSEALDVQARHSADFTVTSFCKEGSIGAEHQRTMMV